MEFVPKKLYYKIREVCDITGVEAHVLRFWETEFPALSPPKGRNGRRVYRPRDIELILEIQKLLYEDGYTIVGARKHMGMSAPESAPKKKPQPSVSATKHARPSSGLKTFPLFDSISFDSISNENAVPIQEKVEIPHTPNTDDNHQTSTRLKRVQTELESILTLLDRE